MNTPPPADRRVLEGKRILVTRAAHQAGKLSEGLRALGAKAVEVPVIEIQPPANLAPLDHALRSLDSYEWLILTSANAVRALAGRSALLNNPLGRVPGLKVAAVGEATATTARKVGLPVSLVPKEYVAESLVDELVNEAGHAGALKGRVLRRVANTPGNSGALARGGSLHGLRFLIARAAIARDVIPDALRAAGATVDVVDAYRNVMPKAAPELLRKALVEGIDAATFTSSSSVTHLADAARTAGIKFPIAGVLAISIGPITSQTLREHNWEPATEASVSSIPGLIAALQCTFTA